MKNFVFISPNFPSNYWRFCKELKADGVRVLGIGDCPYFGLSIELRDNLSEYFYVPSLENEEDVFKAVAFFAFKYGPIDYIESNNEYWLERDAHLRTMFNVKSGFMDKDMKKVKLKSVMKRYFKKAGIKAPLCKAAKSVDVCKKFAAEVGGYPILIKPDNGVGAVDTHKIESDEDLENFFKNKRKGTAYIVEEFVEGVVNSYDAIVNSKGVPIFETGNVSFRSIMDIVNKQDNSVYYILNEPYEDVLEAGRKTAKAFGVKSRFVHFEYFRLTKDQRIGKKGDLVALEVNMRPSGGYSPDMMNYANSTDVYKIWADMITKDSTDLVEGEKYYCAFASRRDGKDFVLTDDEVKEKFALNMRMARRMPDALSGAMGNRMFIAVFKKKEEMDEFYDWALKEK